MRVVVVGGGLAGTLLVQRCLERGVDALTWIDQRGPRASDVPCALVHPFVGRSFQPRPGLAEAWRASRDWLEALPEDALVHRAPLRRWLDDNPAASRLERSWNAHRNAIEGLVRGSSGSTGGARWLAYEPAFGVALGPTVAALTADLCRQGIERVAAQVRALHSAGAQWRLETDAGDVHAEAVLVAAGRGTAALLSRWCPTVELAGYAGSLRHAPASEPLPWFHVDGGHLCSTRGVVAWGSTYSAVANGVEPDPGPALDALETRLRRRLDWPHGADVRVWSGVRTVEVRSREPWAGKVGRGLFVLSALGSKGGLWTPWLAARVVAELVAERER